MCIDTHLHSFCCHRPFLLQRKKYDFDKVAEMWQEGKSAKEIAEECGVSVNYLCLYASKHRDLYPVRQKNTRN